MTMVRLFLITFLLITSIFSSMAQESNYEIIPSEQDDELIYKGSCSFADISAVPAFNWNDALNDYEPDSVSISILKEKLPAYQLSVFLGTWCEDSHRLIPQLYKVLQEAGYPLEQVGLEALDQNKKGRNNSEQQYDVLFVHTILVFKEGVLIGKITETVQESIEGDLANMMK